MAPGTSASPRPPLEIPIPLPAGRHQGRAHRRPPAVRPRAVVASPRIDLSPSPVRGEGIGQALLETSQLDADGRQRNPHLLDYKLVTASDAPRIDVAWIETPAENGGPRGTKGVGEPPTVPTPGAIANAIAQVVGARVRDLPMTPERVWAAAAERPR